MVDVVTGWGNPAAILVAAVAAAAYMWWDKIRNPSPPPPDDDDLDGFSQVDDDLDDEDDAGVVDHGTFRVSHEEGSHVSVNPRRRPAGWRRRNG